MYRSGATSHVGFHRVPNPEEQVAIRRILVPIDAALAPERTVAAIATLAHAFSALVILVAAYESDSGLPSGNRGIGSREYKGQLTPADLEERLAGVKAMLRPQMSHTGLRNILAPWESG